MNRRGFFAALAGLFARPEFAAEPASAYIDDGHLFYELADRPFVVLTETVSFEEFKRRSPVSMVRLAQARMTDVERTESMLRAKRRRDRCVFNGPTMVALPLCHGSGRTSTMEAPRVAPR